jgi:hypothetical protein
MRSRHPAKTSLFRLSSLWLLAFRLDKQLTSLPSLDERAAAARSLFPLFSPPVGWWSPFFMMNGFVLLLLPHNPPLLSCFAHCHIRTFLLLLDRLFLFFRRLDCKLRPWSGSSNQRVPMIKNPARTREKIVIKTRLVWSHYLSSNNRKTKVTETKSITLFIRRHIVYAVRSNNLQNLLCCRNYFIFRLADGGIVVGLR